jgi:uncharacterized membrane protein YeaQ/YmgE (transglycosylase-associated protein family)
MPMILFLVVIGAAAGLFATRLMRVEADLPTSVFVGVAGAVLGWLALRFVLTISGWVVVTAAAIGGAVALIWLWKTYIAK